MEINTSNLYVGQVFKNYKDLCNKLGLEVASGKQKTIQMDEIQQRYFRFSKEKHKHKITIEEIYPIPREKIDNRKGNSGTSEGSRGNNNIYGSYIDNMLSIYLTNQQTHLVYLTTNKLALISGLVNMNYSFAFSNKVKYYNYSFDEMNGVVNERVMWDFFGSVKSSIHQTVHASLKRLVKKDYISFEEAHIFAYDHNTRAASSIEETLIRNFEDLTLEKMGINRNKLQYTDRLRNEFYTKIQEFVNKEISDVDTVYKGYVINIYTKERMKEEPNHKDQKITLNEIFIKRTKEKIISK